jgi:glutaredoxin
MTVAKTMAGTMMALLLCAGGAGAQQMYKWVDASGKITFSDKPPPANAKPIEIKAGAGGAATVPLPYTLAQAVRAYPVVLYTRPKCDFCDKARTFLKERGVPFNEKTVQTTADEAKLKEAGSDGRLPYIIVGRAKSTGFDSGAWNTMLSEATYPEKKILPPSYQFPKPTSAAPPEPVVPKVDEKAKAASDAESAPQKQEKTSPPAFVF